MAKKTKSQRLNNGEIQEYYDVDAVHNLDSDNRYDLAVDSQGKIIAVKREEPVSTALVTDGLIHRYKIQDGVLKDLVTDEDATPGKSYSGETFRGLSNGLVIPSIESTCSIEMVRVMPTSGNAVQKKISLTTSEKTGTVSFVPRGSGWRAFQGYWSSTGYEGFAGYAGNVDVFSQYRVSEAPKIPRDVGNSHPFDSDRYTCGLYFDVNAETAKNKKYSINGILRGALNEANAIRSSTPVTISLDDDSFFEVRVYNRVLTNDEIVNNSKYDGTHYSLVKNTEMEHIYNGYEHFGGRPAMKSKDAVIPDTTVFSETEVGDYVDADGHQYSIAAFSDYEEPARTDSVFEGIKFVSVPEKLYTFRKYSVVAVPYPLYGGSAAEGNGQWHIVYSSSDSSVCACVNGVLVPKKTGTVTITARLAGTQDLTDSFSVAVEEFDNTVDDMDTLFVPETYMVGVHALDSKNPKSCTLAMFSAILEASAAGFHRILFPKKDYTICPVFDYGEGKLCLKVPSDLQIDFGGSNIYIAETEHCLGDKTHGYRLFAFEDGCENSEICNATFYGERYFNNGKHAESDYCEQCSVLLFSDCHECGARNVTILHGVGFQCAYSTAGQYDYWSGIRDQNYTVGSGLANRGRIVKDELEVGRYNANGEKVAGDGYIRTVTKMNIGYDWEALKRFCFGMMGNVYYKVSSRWLRVWWFDENEELLNPGGTLYFQYAGYDLPAGAKYFELEAYNSTPPTQNYGEDSCVLRLYPFRQAENCYITGMVAKDVNGWAMTVTGGWSNYVGNSVFEQTKRWSYYAVDLEDNYFAMGQNVFDNLTWGGINLHGGWGHALLSCIARGTYRAIYVRDECFCTRVMNCTAESIYKSSKADSVYRGNLETTQTTTSGVVGFMLETDLTSTGTNNLEGI